MPHHILAGDFKRRAAVLAEHGVTGILGLALKAVNGAANLSPLGTDNIKNSDDRLGLN